MAPPDSESPQVPAEPMIETFCATLAQGSPFAEERAVVQELAIEARPVLEALYFAWTVVEQQGGDPLGQAHEALAMLTLLGRRTALSGLTPTAALAVVPALRAGLTAGGIGLPETTVRTLNIVCMEGYAAGREDRAAQRLHEALVSAQRFVELAPGVLLWSAAGPLDAAVVGEVSEALGRHALHEEIAACVLDAAGLVALTDACARELVELLSQLEKLGAAVFVVAGDADRSTWAAAAGEVELRLYGGSAEAVQAALRHAGYALGRAAGWRRLFGG